MLRTNGVLSGLIFAWDAAATLPRLRAIVRTRDTEQLTRFLSTLAAGALVGAGFAAPQVLAYVEFCTGVAADDARP
ncbi:ER membrane glycoprotein subunit of the GPI transamidase complex-like protein, partial [Teratosphaeriaceae sp. CCFEE 6253]